MKILINNTDVSIWYRTGSLNIEDSLNQPVTCSVELRRVVNSAVLPVEVEGGETLTVLDDSQIYFDGVIPVEGGIGRDFEYLDKSVVPARYAAAIRVSASDFQTALDYVNCPEVTYYDEPWGSIQRDLISRSSLGPFVDTTAIADGQVVPELTVAGRKFSNIAKDGATANGYYFSLRTKSLGPRQLVAEFRSVQDGIAPFTVDAAAQRYIIRTLKLDPPSRPLINKVTVTGGLAPSEFPVVDVFDCDGNTGSYALSRTPFYLRSSEVASFDAGRPLVDQPTAVVTSGSAFSTSSNLLQMTGTGGFWLKRPYRSRNHRFAIFEDLVITAASSNIVVGVFSAAPAAGGLANCLLGAWFKPGGTLSMVRDGAEVVPQGAPAWVVDDSYFVRVKETSAGTMLEIHNERLAPVRHWFPMRTAGLKASGSITINGLPIVGDEIVWRVGDITLPPYVVTAPAEASLTVLHREMAAHANGLALFSGDYVAGNERNHPVLAATATNPATVTLPTGAGVASGDLLVIDSAVGIPEINGSWYVLASGSPDTFDLLACDASGGGTYVANSATMHAEDATCYLAAKQEGAQFNQPLEAFAPVAVSWVGMSSGADPGDALGANGTTLYAGVWCASGTANLTKVQVRDPLGIDARLERADSVRTAGTLSVGDFQALTYLTVASPDEFSVGYAAQLQQQGSTSSLAFFGDEESLPKAGDRLRVTYYAEEPIRIPVINMASVEEVKARSQSPGDTGVREGADLDVAGRVSTLAGAAAHGRQYVSLRSRIPLNGSVLTTTWHTQGSLPRSGQLLPIELPNELLSRRETISQVRSTHINGDHWESRVSFGSIPDEFLLPVESPSTRSAGDALSYSVSHAEEALEIIEEITFT